MEARTINRKDERCPEILRKIDDAPQKLFYKGAWEKSLFKNCLAVVGARKMTHYGRIMTRKIVEECAASGLTIVSGFMYGIDAEAHRAALRAGGKTIAVMPCGIELVHPEWQRDLYEEILREGGLILSEYAENMQPSNWTYPRRNRIVAGLSKAVLVVEAGEKSGSLITAHLAQRYNRPVFAVPGPITSSVSAGIYQLLKKEGAIMATNAGDVLSYFKLGPKQQKSTTGLLDVKNITERKIIQQLQSQAMDADTLSRELDLASDELAVSLSLLQMRGSIGEENGLYYIK